MNSTTGKFRLDIKRDVDVYGPGDYGLWLPYGFRFADDTTHTRSFESMAELKKAAREDVVPCDCRQCRDNLEKGGK